MLEFNYESLQERLDRDKLVLTIPTPAIPDPAEASRAWCSQLIGAMLWFASQEKEAFVWRGQGNADWPLQSRLNRYVATQRGLTSLDEVASVETDIVTYVRRQRWDRHDGSPLRFLELLAVLQHHGVPTRLLDVTRDPLVAGFFASAPAAGPGREPNGAVIAIRIPRNARVDDRITAANTFADGVSFTPAGAAYALYEPPGLDLRFVAQRGLFLVPNVKREAHAGSYAPDGPIGVGIDFARGGYTGSIDSFFKNYLSAPGAGRPPKNPINILMIVVPGSRKAALRAYLAQAGLNDRNLFPDLDGYASSFPPC